MTGGDGFYIDQFSQINVTSGVMGWVLSNAEALELISYEVSIYISLSHAKELPKAFS